MIVTTRWLSLMFVTICAVASAQQPIGTVGLQDATVVGALEVSQGRAVLAGNTDVTAGAHIADVTLSRGGSVRICATSRLHATGGKTLAGPAPLVLALDHGAIEVQMPATGSDVVMTPDLRFTLHGSGPLDLELRVTRNGDTCVDNRGPNAPTLSVAEQFGDASYELRAGQHVLFEHGSLKEVVDHESTSCGCPPEPAMTVADALVKAGAPAKPEPADAATPAKTAAEEHPFPAAVSEGLAPAAVTPQAPVGAVHAQVSATLSSGNAADSTSVPGASAGTIAGETTEDSHTAAGPSTAPPATAQAPAPRGGVIHAVGRFFRRLIGRE